MSTTDPSSEAEVQAALDSAHAKAVEAHNLIIEVLAILDGYGYKTEADEAVRALACAGLLRYRLFVARGGQL